jgi:uncharacterized membrane protein
MTRKADWKETLLMTELIVVSFKKDMYRASEALNMLQDMNNTWMVDLSDAVAVYRPSGVGAHEICAPLSV